VTGGSSFRRGEPCGRGCGAACRGPIAYGKRRRDASVRISACSAAACNRRRLNIGDLAIPR
jgi:hypothetical protein